MRMTAKTVPERQNELRQRRKDLGLVRLELFVHINNRELVKACAEKLEKKRRQKAGVL